MSPSFPFHFQIFMILGWGFLLPMGVIIAHFGKNVKPPGWWFRQHRMIQTMGLLCGIIGLIIAVVMVQDATGNHFSRAHHTVGIIVMTIGILQPFNAFFRPHPPTEGEAKTFNRLVWEVVHKGCGYSAIVLGVLNIFGGAKIAAELIPAPDGEAMSSQFLALEGAALAITFGLAIYLAGTRSGTAYARMVFDDDWTKQYSEKKGVNVGENPAITNYEDGDRDTVSSSGTV
jgi:hypothetical protein